MGKKKLEERTITAPIDVESPNSVPPSRHRTCWQHTAAFLHACRKKIRKNKLKRLELTSPCFFGTYPLYLRSKRRIEPKNAIPKVIIKRQKLNTAIFDNYFENLWNSCAEDKKISFVYLESLWFNMYATKKDSKEKVVKWIKRREIFSKKYVLVPIVRWFVLDLYRSEGRAETKLLISKFPFLVPKVPQQRNDTECGNFVLYFMKLFVQFAPENFTMDGYPYFMNQSWFNPESLEHLFEELGSSKRNEQF